MGCRLIAGPACDNMFPIPDVLRHAGKISTALLALSRIKP
jgi:hypothetical protein